MNDYATKDDLKELDQKLDKRFDDIVELIQGFMQQVDDRFNKVEFGLENVKGELSKTRQEIVDLRVSHDRLLNTIDAFVGRLDRQEAEQAARDNQFEKLLAWARKVSEKTGIPLENL
ncbi:MAG: hypothetical protein WBP26_00960 [Candidatus Saccharimonadales bacterium]